MDQIIVNCETGESSRVSMTADEIAAIQQTRADAAAATQAAEQQAVTLKAQTIAAFTTEYHSLSTAAGPLTAALMLHQSMEVARQSFNLDIQPADLPADLQQGLASLPA